MLLRVNLLPVSEKNPAVLHRRQPDFCIFPPVLQGGGKGEHRKVKGAAQGGLQQDAGNAGKGTRGENAAGERGGEAGKYPRQKDGA
ncbi:MAG: hypothetical protein IJO13_00250, partial [Lachnospiraceae bacterium]|nr:hypothetical protein [Lachnospiraceae bacterium]